jgi:hypothetical protein
MTAIKVVYVYYILVFVVILLIIHVVRFSVRPFNCIWGHSQMTSRYFQASGNFTPPLSHLTGRQVNFWHTGRCQNDLLRMFGWGPLPPCCGFRGETSRCVELNSEVYLHTSQNTSHSASDSNTYDMFCHEKSRFIDLSNTS